MFECPNLRIICTKRRKKCTFFNNFDFFSNKFGKSK